MGFLQIIYAISGELPNYLPKSDSGQEIVAGLKVNNKLTAKGVLGKNHEVEHHIQIRNQKRALCFLTTRANINLENCCLLSQR